MKTYIPILAKTQLFAGVSETDISAMLPCLEAKAGQYPKGAYVCRQGEHWHQIMVLLSGGLHIQKDDYWGNRSIVNPIGVGEMFGEAYISPQSGVLLNDVVAVEDSMVMFFNVAKIMTTCSSACVFHTMVVQNLFFSISEKNRKLVRKLGHMSGRSTRDKLMSYLSEEASCNGSGRFVIPFDRQGLADFLSVDRSAMSRELCKMRDEGLLRFHKNHFELL